MSALTHEEAIKRAEYIGQVAEAELFETDRRGGYSCKLKDAIHETQLPRLSRHSVSGGWATFFMPLHETWVALLPPQGREEIFSEDKFVADAFFPHLDVHRRGCGA